VSSCDWEKRVVDVETKKIAADFPASGNPPDRGTERGLRRTAVSRHGEEASQRRAFDSAASAGGSHIVSLLLDPISDPHARVFRHP